MGRKKLDPMYRVAAPLICVPKGPGTYALLLRATAPRTVTIGSLGPMSVSPGYYVYVGSALKGLRGRLSRHLTPVHKITLKWHVDYIRQVTSVVEIWVTESRYRWECPWVKVMLALPRAQVPEPKGFGSSDDKGKGKCITHLAYFSVKPSLEAFRARVGELSPAGCLVQQLVVRQED
jgi:Uri superfamily endonuclease